jgi:asparagine synthase (glutamine-hydrolysing)
MTKALAHRRLSIINLSEKAAQPMTLQSGNAAILYNEEIYNYVELKEELRKCSVTFRTESDTEVLLAAHEAWGMKCLVRLNGIFAFAIWDEEKQILFAARDRLGEKPFFFHQGRDFFIFASKMKAILASGLVCIESNHYGVYRYLVLRDIDSDQVTLFKGIQTLHPAHALSYTKEEGRLGIWRYWDLVPEHKLHYKTDREYEKHFLELLDDAVRIRLRADVPVGSSLSGKWDSSAVACLISQYTKGRGRATFSARFRDPRYNEGLYIAAVVDRTRTSGYSVYPNPARLPEEIDKLSWHQEEPFFSTSVYEQWNVMRLAGEKGVTVLFDGRGGDETMAGYVTYHGPYLLGLLQQGRYCSLLRDLVGFTQRQGLHDVVLSLLYLLLGRTQRFLRHYFRSTGVPIEFLRQWRCKPHGGGAIVCADPLHNALYGTLAATTLPVLLRYADRNSMAFSREVRFSFLDHHLVKFLFSLPSDQLIRRQTTKRILRHAAIDVLPLLVRERTSKMGFAPLQAAWMKNELKDWISQVLSSPGFQARPWVEASAVRQMWLAFLAGRYGQLLPRMAVDLARDLGPVFSGSTAMALRPRVHQLERTL